MSISSPKYTDGNVWEFGMTVYSEDNVAGLANHNKNNFLVKWVTMLTQELVLMRKIINVISVAVQCFVL